MRCIRVKFLDAFHLSFNSPACSNAGEFLDVRSQVQYRDAIATSPLASIYKLRIRQLCPGKPSSRKIYFCSK
ncbi:hypothetical protein HRE53_23815 [Acaryochloris sp. 'Moss Beach']|uniref:hypothetical protein n=1 Tax=Acaryochloris sp. 'Moss Beach' TaxID=2740837 RepID=UPI001F419E6E|nr:hypothetical protein [Acaryochloris sp. 'Moss Beach']UJB69349.1 hypothetical protein HRE53_23815 [Acaryochloris sp. 'Moss Beach']